MEVIARIFNDMPDKFGLPRQGLLCPHFVSRIVMEKEYGMREAFRGLEMYSHLWLLWEFEAMGLSFSPTVRPPRLGGNERIGVFATRSPNRPNRIGMSVVELKDIEFSQGTTVLTVAGADIRSGTPIYDIKPYIPYADSVSDARCDMGEAPERALSVVWDCGVPFDAERRAALEEMLSLDPRPAYQKGAGRVYRMTYGGREVSFTVSEGVLTVTRVV